MRNQMCPCMCVNYCTGLGWQLPRMGTCFDLWQQQKKDTKLFSIILKGIGGECAGHRLIHFSCICCIGGVWGGKEYILLQVFVTKTPQVSWKNDKELWDVVVLHFCSETGWNGGRAGRQARTKKLKINCRYCREEAWKSTNKVQAR